MKQLFIYLMVLVHLTSIAQDSELKGLGSLPLCISTTKTTSLVFPFAIRYVDRGTEDVLVQQVKDAENIILVKAGRKHFPGTNLSVVVADGKVYSFDVQYDSMPANWIYTVVKKEQGPGNQNSVVFNTETINEADLSFYLNGLLFKKANARVKSDYSWGVKLSVDGIYVKDDVLFFRIPCINNSSLDYAVDDTRFLIRDAIKSKRTAVQEREIELLQKAPGFTLIKAGESRTTVVAVKKFTIPNAKFMVIQLMEKNGGRNLQVRISNRHITRAGVLKE